VQLLREKSTKQSATVELTIKFSAYSWVPERMIIKYQKEARTSLYVHRRSRRGKESDSTK
jgi:hypothetical protein